MRVGVRAVTGAAPKKSSGSSSQYKPSGPDAELPREVEVERLCLESPCNACLLDFEATGPSDAAALPATLPRRCTQFTGRSLPPCVTVVGLLDTCEHVFHTECIQRWAEKENSCPQCKKIFNYVGCYVCDGRRLDTHRVVHKTQSETYRNGEDDEDDNGRGLARSFAAAGGGDADNDAAVCQLCEAPGESALLLCDGRRGACQATYHYFCVGLDEIPDGDWFCPECVRTNRCTTTSHTLQTPPRRGRRAAALARGGTNTPITEAPHSSATRGGRTGRPQPPPREPRASSSRRQTGGRGSTRRGRGGNRSSLAATVSSDSPDSQEQRDELDPLERWQWNGQSRNSMDQILRAAARGSGVGDPSDDDGNRQLSNGSQAPRGGLSRRTAPRQWATRSRELDTSLGQWDIESLHTRSPPPLRGLPSDLLDAREYERLLLPRASITAGGNSRSAAVVTVTQSTATPSRSSSASCLLDELLSSPRSAFRRPQGRGCTRPNPQSFVHQDQPRIFATADLCHHPTSLPPPSSSSLLRIRLPNRPTDGGILTTGNDTSGAAASGAATSGAATSATATSATATSGAATSGAATSATATSGAATSATATSGAATSATAASGTASASSDSSNRGAGTERRIEEPQQALHDTAGRPLAVTDAITASNLNDEFSRGDCSSDDAEYEDGFARSLEELDRRCTDESELDCPDFIYNWIDNVQATLHVTNGTDHRYDDDSINSITETTPVVAVTGGSGATGSHLGNSAVNAEEREELISRVFHDNEVEAGRSVAVPEADALHRPAKYRRLNRNQRREANADLHHGSEGGSASVVSDSHCDSQKFVFGGISDRHAVRAFANVSTSCGIEATDAGARFETAGSSQEEALGSRDTARTLRHSSSSAAVSCCCEKRSHQDCRKCRQRPRGRLKPSKSLVSLIKGQMKLAGFRHDLMLEDQAKWRSEFRDTCRSIAKGLTETHSSRLLKLSELEREVYWTNERRLTHISAAINRVTASHEAAVEAAEAAAIRLDQLRHPTTTAVNNIARHV